MRLFSTILDINDNLTQESFVRLLVKWNQSSPLPENVIKDFKYTEDLPFKFGTDKLYIEADEYCDKNSGENIIAARYENNIEDGPTRSMEIVVNFNQKKISVINDWSYSEETLKNNVSRMAPNFITYLIDGDCLKDDAGLPILYDPIYIREDDVEKVAKIINGETSYSLPIVYVSKKQKDGEDPLDVNKLAGWLRGAAHVFVEQNSKVSNLLRKLCNDQNAHNGAVEIYYPNALPKRFYNSRRYSLMLKVAQSVIDYVKLQEIPDLYTWIGVETAKQFNELKENSIIIEAADESIKDLEKAKASREKSVENLEETVKKLENKIRDLNYTINKLQTPQVDVDAKPLIYFGEDDGYFDGEILEIVMEALERALGTYHEEQRRYDVIRGVIDNNEYPDTLIQNQKKIKAILKTYTGKDDTKAFKELRKMGFTIKRDTDHVILVYYNRDDLEFVMSSTPSVQNAGKKSASLIDFLLF